MQTMENRICMVTGTTSGIGKATAMGLAQMGATVVMVARDPDRGGRAVEEVKAASGNGSVDLMLCDLASMRQVRALGEEFKTRYQQLHVLIHNAGVLFPPVRDTEDGLETTFAVNHLAPFLLTNILLDVIKASTPARIVAVASSSHRLGSIDFDLIEGKKRWRGLVPGWRAYNQSKLANVLFTNELARRLAGTGVTANSVHPGMVATNVATSGKTFMGRLINLFRPFGVRLILKLPLTFLLTSEQGARTSIYLASSAEVAEVSGKYFVRNAEVRSSRKSHDRSLAQRLWEFDNKLAGIDNN